MYCLICRKIEAEDKKRSNDGSGTNSGETSGHPFGFCEIELPLQLKLALQKRESTVWSFYHLLKTKVSTTVDKKPSKAQKTGMIATWKASTQTKIFTNICKICLKDVQALEHPTRFSSERAVCKVVNVSNAEQHLKTKHGSDVEVQQYFQGKFDKRESNSPVKSIPILGW